MKCPFCAEEIKDEAIKCPFCKEFLEKSKRNPNRIDVCFFRGKLVQHEYMKTAGWFCIVSAVVTFPIFIISFVISGESHSVSSILSFISLGLFIYIFYSLKRLLNEVFDFHLVDTYIMVMIWVNAGGIVISAIITRPDDSFAILTLIALVALGFITIAFAIALMKLKDRLAGLLKPFCYLCIAQGVCMASIILFPLALLASVASDVLLALIFFRTADSVSANKGRDIQ